jgi:hypothetical protein
VTTLEREGDERLVGSQPQPDSTKKARQYDVLGLVGVIGLVVSACWALYLGHSEVAAAGVGGVAGLLTRLYK